jgi:hypothetical protein
MAARQSLVLAAVVALAARGAPAADPAKRPGRYKHGPLYFTPRLELKNAGVDTNLFLTQTGEVPDTSIVLSGGAEGVLPVGSRLRLSGRGSVDFNYFHRLVSERSTDPSGEGLAELTLGRLMLFGGGGGSSSRQRFSIEFDARVPRHEMWATGGSRLDLGSKLSLTLSGKEHRFRYGTFDLGGGQDLRELLDRNTLTANAELRYGLTSKTNVVAVAEVIEDRFLHSAAFASQIARSYRYSGGFEFGPRALIRGRAIAGFRDFPQTAAAGVPAYRGPILFVDASMPVFRIAEVKLAAEREIVYSVNPVGDRAERLRNTAVYSRYRGDLSAEIPFDLVATGSVEFLETRGVFPVVRDGRLLRGVDHVWTVGGSLLRRFGEGVLLGGAVAWSRREGTLPGAAYDRVVYGVHGLVIP